MSHNRVQWDSQKIVIIVEFSSAWLINWLTLFPDKCNLLQKCLKLTAWFLYCFDVALSPYLSPTVAAVILASQFYQSLPLFSYVLKSFLHFVEGDDLWYCIIASAWDLVATLLAKRFFCYSVLEFYTMFLKRSRDTCFSLIHSCSRCFDEKTFQTLYSGCMDWLYRCFCTVLHL